jgi:rSAM/selenodomain-associated transferase 2
MSMISIITPVLNEEDMVLPLFGNLNECNGDFELIIVDGGSTDNTISEIEKRRTAFKHDLTVLRSDRSRAVQMNKGAGIARGSIFLFLHADSLIETDSLIKIERVLKNGHYIGGGYLQYFSGDDDFLKALSELGNMRVRMGMIFYGDYGIFIRKDIFEQMGGYDEIKILEDVELCKKAKKYGKLVQIESLLLTSPRRFENIGKAKLSAIFITALILNIFSKRPEFLVKYISDR